MSEEFIVGFLDLWRKITMPKQQKITCKHTLELTTEANSLCRVEIARLIVDFPIYLKSDMERSIGFDWLSVPKSKFIISMRDDILTIVRSIGCCEGQESDASAYLSYRQDGFLVPVISFWRAESHEGAPDHPHVTEIHDAIELYLRNIFAELPVPGSQKSPADTDELPRAEVVLALSLANQMQRQFGGQPAPYITEIQLEDKNITCKGSMRQSSSSGVATLPDLECEGHVIKWDVKSHMVTLKILNSRSSLTFTYDRDKEESQWRLLRDGLDEEITLVVSLKRSTVDSIDTLELKLAHPPGDLLSGL